MKCFSKHHAAKHKPVPTFHALMFWEDNAQQKQTQSTVIRTVNNK